MSNVTFVAFLIAACLFPSLAKCQLPSEERPVEPGRLADSSVPPNTQLEPERKRLFGIIPNYRSATIPNPYTPIGTEEKFKIATRDSFDRGTAILAAAFAGEGQLANSNPDFGHGAAAYGRYLGTAYADFVIGDYMTEAIFPSMLRQDPRYFRRGGGGTLSRLGYAAGQIFWTHNDSGKSAFNFSEIGGNATAVGISNAYYPGSRDVGDNVTKLGTQLGVDMASNILKEFSSDIYRKFSRKH